VIWEVESVFDADAEYNTGGPDSRGGYHAYRVVDGEGRVLFDSLNRDAGVSEIREDVGGESDSVHAWDERASVDLTLAASAPDLIEALETMRRWAIPGMDWTDDIGREILAVVDTAIAKAKGVDA
jgi:hypothetical protein